MYPGVPSISASKCIPKLAPSWPPSASPKSLDHGLPVNLRTQSITASKYIVQERQWVYKDTGLAEVEWVTRSIYSGDPGADRHHLIFISSCHTMKIHTLSFPSLGLPRSFRDFVDPHGQVVSYLLTFFLRCSSLM